MSLVVCDGYWMCETASFTVTVMVADVWRAPTVPVIRCPATTDSNVVSHSNVAVIVNVPGLRNVI